MRKMWDEGFYGWKELLGKKNGKPVESDSSEGTIRSDYFSTQLT